MAIPLASRLVYLRPKPVVGVLAGYLLSILGVEFPKSVRVGPGLIVQHKGFGLVVHPKTIIGSNVSIFHGVTIGRKDPWVPIEETKFGGVIIGNGVVLCPGAKVIGGQAPLIVGQGTIVGANSVLLCSTGADEIWAGIPAKRIGLREAPPGPRLQSEQ
jgi:serine O-acetyltransferase